MARLAQILIFLAALGLAAPAPATTLPDGPVMNIEGTWFSCEFAHSQIPPEDGCLMLDDDGFVVSRGRIDHVKVTDSKQTNCRHQRTGQCFHRTRERVVVIRDDVGPIRATASGFAITYWGCTQEYTMRKRGRYYEVAPTGDRCLWTREKRYFVTRFQGRIDIGKN